MSKHYETVFILVPTLKEDEIKASVEKFTNLISSNGEITKVDEWGKRKLAYEINKVTEGYYVYVEFTAEGDFVKELERNYKISDSVLRYLVVKQEK